jgi:ABC-type nitrate/sulfonate/bicarbonate transport system substrate-binding protein
MPGYEHSDHDFAGLERLTAAERIGGETAINRLTLTRGLVVLIGLGLLVACVGPESRATSTAGLNPVAPGTASPAAALVPSAPVAAPSPSPTPLRELALRLTIASSEVGRWALVVAQQRGYFDRAALKLNINVADDPTVALDPTAAQKLDLALVSGEALVRAVDRGAPLRLVAGTVNAPTWSLVVGREIGAVPDLKDRAVGVSDPKSVTAVLMRRLLAKHGLPPETYRLVTLGNNALLTYGVTNGTADGALLEPARTAQLKALGFRVLGASKEVAPDLQVEGVAVRPDWARQNEEALLRFLRVLAEAESWLVEPSNREEATAALAKMSSISAAEAREAYDSVLEQRQTLARAAELSPSGMKALLELIGEAAPTEKPSGGPERYVDDSYLEKARR